MPIPLTTAQRTALQSGSVKLVWLMTIELAEETMRFCSYDQPITYDSQTYEKGMDKWKLTGRVGSSSNLTPEPLNISFDGGDQYIDGTITRRILTQTWHLRPISLTGLMLDPSDDTVIGPFFEWEGFLDSAQIGDTEGNPSTLVITAEGGAFRALSKNHRKCTDADQRTRDASDTFFINTGVKPSQNIPFGISWSKVPGNGNTNNSDDDTSDFSDFTRF